jgi:hypothetical protein
MKEINVTTGFGYLKDGEGNIIAKCRLKKGKHSINNQNTYEEVADEAALNAIEIVIKADPETEEEILEKKIQAELRSMAIESLQIKGEI